LSMRVECSLSQVCMNETTLTGESALNG
jgi:hypothetical protein